MNTLRSIADTVGGVVIGDGDYKIRFINSLENATGDSISFFGDQKKQHLLGTTQAGAVLISREYVKQFAGNKIVVSDPYLAYAKISKLFKRYPLDRKIGIQDTARISTSATMGKGVGVGHFSVIADGAKIGSNVLVGNHVSIGEEVEIGDESVIEDHVVISAGCRVGSRCCISPGAIIGASGFGYAPDEGKWEKIEQLGSVFIGDDVDIGANTTIDRGALENTVIGNGVKLDNQIQIAHNVQVGDDTIMAGCVAIAGSARIGKRCKFGGRVSILGHLEIVDDVSLMADSLVVGSIKIPGEYSSAISVQPVKRWRKNVAILRRLDKLVKQVKILGKDNS